jgi:hypothetical protein
MKEIRQEDLNLPSSGQIRQAIGLYLDLAFGRPVPPAALRFLPPESFNVPDWLMSDLVERDPASAGLAGVRSFALRIGNAMYPHMKLRLSRPPNDAIYLFSVDSHDGFLCVSPDSPDCKPLEQLKAYNAEVCSKIMKAWSEHHLPTERDYLRAKIREAIEQRRGE